MKKTVRFRFWLESIMAFNMSILILYTLIRPDWIEITFHVDPDAGSGVLEWLIVAVLLVAVVACIAHAGFEWRRVKAIS